MNPAVYNCCYKSLAVFGRTLFSFFGLGVYSLEIGSLAAVSRQKMEDNSE